MQLDDVITWPILISSPSVFLWVALWGPIIVWLLKKLWRKSNIPHYLKLAIALLLIASTISIPLWDVYPASIQRNKYCNDKAGMFVYKTVEGVEGVLTDASYLSQIAIGLGYGFSEYESHKGLYRVHKEGGGFKEEQVKSITSRYYFSEEKLILNRQIKRIIWFVAHNETGERLGELVDYYYYPGWLDRTLLGWQGHFTPINCNLEFEKKDLYVKVLIPASQINIQ